METVSPENDTDAVQLKKVLEWELSLDGRDLRSHAWYHGAIPRIRAEEIVGDRDGNFLVRDCTSQPGNYVLSCRSKGQKLHFVINKIILQPDTVYETVQYRFEEDGFDTVPDLITYYVGSGKSITSASGAKIQTPRNRAYPLSFYANKYETVQQLLNRNGRLDSSNSSLCGGTSPIASPPRSRRDLSSSSWSRSGCKKQRSLSLLPGDANALSRVVLDDLKSTNAFDNGTRSSFSHSLPRRSFSSKIRTAVPSPVNTSSNTTIPRNIDKQSKYGRSSPSFERKEYANGIAAGQHDTLPSAPPKPNRYYNHSSVRDDTQLACKEFTRKNSIYLPSGGSDSGNGSGDSVHSCSAVDESTIGQEVGGSESSNCSTPVSTMQRRSAGVVIKNPKYYGLSSASSVTTLKAYSYDPLVEDVSLSMAAIGADLPSAFDLETFHTLLLPTIENKPLDTTSLQGIHMLLMDSGSRILANHLTRVDLELTVHKLKEDVDYMCKTGIELCLLPHGHQHRLDLIERTQCLKLIVAVTILMCATESERAELLNKWIEVAIDTKTALGNLFGFCAIMLGLCIPQIQRLNETWHILRQKYTDSAFNFEAKLRPVLKSMNESTNPLAPNTTIPHLLPIILLYERTLDETSDDLMDKSNSLSSTIGQWETITPDLGLSTLYLHLNSTRHYHKSLSTFKRNAEIVLSDSKVDDLLMDMFRTEFHLKFLWGSRGATVSSTERYSKFEKILDVMSEKCENLDEREPSPEVELINYATSV